MNKLEKAKRREAARVLLIQAHDMIAIAKTKMLGIDSDKDDKVIELWKKVSNNLNNLSSYNLQKDMEGK